MLILRALLGLACFLTFAAVAWAGPGESQATEELHVREHLQELVPTYELHAESLLDALLQISAHFRLPIGVEWTQDSDTRREIELHFSQQRIETMLNATVTSYANYSWALAHGVVRIYPRWASDEHSFLRLPVANFSEKDAFVLFASRDLQRHVNGIVAPLLVSPGRAGSAASGLGDRRVTLEFTRTGRRNRPRPD